MTTNHKDDGGPAFPVECRYPADGTGPKQHQTGPYTGWEMGMTLRDYFAARSIAIAWDAFDKGYCGDVDASDTSTDQVAKLAYQIADAMLKARGEA